MMSLYNVLEMQNLDNCIIQGNLVVSILQIKKTPHASLMQSVIRVSQKLSCTLSFHTRNFRLDQLYRHEK